MALPPKTKHTHKHSAFIHHWWVIKWVNKIRIAIKKEYNRFQLIMRPTRKYTLKMLTVLFYFCYACVRERAEKVYTHIHWWSASTATPYIDIYLWSPLNQRKLDSIKRMWRTIKRDVVIVYFLILLLRYTWMMVLSYLSPFHTVL